MTIPKHLRGNNVISFLKFSGPVHKCKGFLVNILVNFLCGLVNFWSSPQINLRMNSISAFTCEKGKR